MRPTARQEWAKNAMRLLAVVLALALSAPGAMAQGLAVNPSAAASDIRNPSSIVPGAAASDIRNPSATNPAAAASEIRQPLVPNSPPVLRGRSVAPMPVIRTERRARRPSRAREGARAARRAPARADAAQVRDAAPVRRTERERATDRKASGIMGSVCQGC
ncbi:MAG TPA: hypothetical protein VF601_09455 [Beijerinckiaceae bacterium]|jgi:hypothetical protein